MARVQGTHLVGSVPLADTATVLRTCVDGLPNRLKRIPDGETGVRHYFVSWQLEQFFRHAPEMLIQWKDNSPVEDRCFTPEQVSAGIEKLRRADPRTGYDDFAIESYKTFVKLRDEGVIPAGVRFQVSFPSLVNVLVAVERDFQKEVANIYETALLRDLRSFQDAIPHEDLSIQLDLALDTLFWEDNKIWKPWFHSQPDELELRKTYLLEYVLRMITCIDPDVELGIHNCYGDMEHKHIAEPESLAAITERGLALWSKTPHPIQYFHLPVPISAMDKLEAYYKPLLPLIPKLREHDTELYLGLIHANDLEGTMKRIQVAQTVLNDVDFGVATECGWGRTPQHEIESIMQISTAVSEEIVRTAGRASSFSPST